MLKLSVSVLALVTAKASAQGSLCRDHPVTPESPALCQSSVLDRLPAFVPRHEWNARRYDDPKRENAGVTRSGCDCSTDQDIVPFTAVESITIHHTAYDFANNRAEGVSLTQWAQNLHLDSNNWCDVGYHFLMDGEGTLYQGRAFFDDPDDGEHYWPSEFLGPKSNRYGWPFPRFIRGSHAGGANDNNIGISVHGCFDSVAAGCPRPTDISSDSAIVESLATTVAHLVQLFPNTVTVTENAATGARDVKLHVYGHRDWKSTSCPGERLYALLPDIAVRATRVVCQGDLSKLPPHITWCHGKLGSIVLDY